MEELKRTQEFQVDEFSKGKLIENQNTINELMAKDQELQSEIKCMKDSRECKDAESVRSGQLSHVPREPELFPFLLLSRARNPQPETWITHVFSGNVFANSPAYSSTPYSGMLNSWDVHATGKIQMQASTRQPEAESGARDKDTIPTPRFLRSPSARHSFNPMEGQLLRIMEQTNNDVKSRNFTLTNSPLHKHFRVGKQDSRLKYALDEISLRRQCYGSKK